MQNKPLGDFCMKLQYKVKSTSNLVYYLNSILQVRVEAQNVVFVWKFLRSFEQRCLLVGGLHQCHCHCYSRQGSVAQFHHTVSVCPYSLCKRREKHMTINKIEYYHWFSISFFTLLTNCLLFTLFSDVFVFKILLQNFYYIWLWNPHLILATDHLLHFQLFSFHLVIYSSLNKRVPYLPYISWHKQGI